MTQTAPDPSPAEIDDWVAAPRFAPFLSASNDQHAAATQLYVWNARLASAFFEVIHHVEVLVRNAMHRELKAAEPEGSLHSWLIDSRILASGDLSVVEATIARLKGRSKPVTDNRVVATLGFGFWASLVGKNYDELWKTTLNRAFPNGTGLRRDTAGPLNRILQLRNGVAHHEAIFGLPIAERYEETIRIAADVNQSAAEWIAEISHVSDVLAQRPFV